MNIAPVRMMSYNTNFGKDKVNYSNHGANEAVPQPEKQKQEQPAVTWSNMGSCAYPVEPKKQAPEEPKDDSRFNKF